MPSKIPGKHNSHVRISNKNYRIIQSYCVAGAEKLTVSGILDLLMEVLIEDHIGPRMAAGESATWDAIRTDIPKVAASVAHKIEPTAFNEDGSLKGDNDGSEYC